MDLGDPGSTQLGSAQQDPHTASACCTPDSLEHPLVQIVERVNPSLEGLVLGGKSVRGRMIQIRRSERNVDQSTEPRDQSAYRWKRPGDSLGHIVRVHLSEPLPGGLNGILEVLVDPREVDRGDGRGEGGLNGFPAEDVDVKGTSEPRGREVKDPGNSSVESLPLHDGDDLTVYLIVGRWSSKVMHEECERSTDNNNCTCTL